MEQQHIISTLTKCFSAILLLTAYSILGFSQASITVRFSGQLDGSAYQRLDSVKVTDISKGWTGTVYYPDTIAILRQTNSLGTITSYSDALYQNAPNPFDCTTTTELAISSQSAVNIQLLDVNGRIITTYNGTLNAGIHKFEISAEKPQTYLLNAKAGAKSYSIRMVNVGNGCGNAIRYIGESQDITAKLECLNQFSIGDNMGYIGYATINGTATASSTIVQQQIADQYITLNFSSQTTLPEVTTLPASAIGTTTATVRGWATGQTQAGFLYGTSPDNLQYNVIATTTLTEEFSRQLTGLTPNTTYYYKAYATNSAGTDTGETLNFTTGSQSAPTLPEVVTLQAAPVGSTTATIKGALTNGIQNIQNTILGFMYGTNSNNLQYNVTATSIYNQEFAYTLSNLTPNTTYYYQAYATNSAGSDIGEIRNFTTEETPETHDITVNFSSRGHSTNYQWLYLYIPLDSVKVQNRTRNWTRTLIFPDTVMNVDLSNNSRLNIEGNASTNDQMTYTGYTSYRGRVYQQQTQHYLRSETLQFMFEIPFCDDFYVHIELTDCEPITYNGVTYTQSGHYEIEHQETSYHCDSVVILDIDIRNQIFNEIVVQTCDESYTWDGITYTESGIYQRMYTSVHGCDSLVSLVLTVGNGFTDQRDGNSYCTITIGDQVWMAENLRYLPSVYRSNQESYTESRYYVYDYQGNNVEEAKDTYNYNEYGVLYNNIAAQTACPAGWHLPSDSEWTELEIYLENHGYNFDGYIDSDNDRDTHNVIGKSMASQSNWTVSDISNSPGRLQQKNNSSGFNGKPAGWKHLNGLFKHINESAAWWATGYYENGNGWDRYLYFSRAHCTRSHNNKHIGLSIRCIQD